MATVRSEQTAPLPQCAYCGQAIATDRPVIERFGERFCSERHAEDFTAAVRAARVDEAARQGARDHPTASGHRRSGAWMIGAVILGVLGIALLWGNWSLGGAIPVGGALLTALLLLACPLAMYFMMRGMSGMHDGGTAQRGSESLSDKRTNPKERGSR